MAINGQGYFVVQKPLGFPDGSPVCTWGHVEELGIVPNGKPVLREDRPLLFGREVGVLVVDSLRHEATPFLALLIMLDRLSRTRRRK